MFDDLEIKEKKKVNLKEVLPVKFYNDLVKCDFIKDVEFMLYNPGLINIEIDDIIAISNSDLVGTISQVLNTTDDEFDYKIISDKEPTDCIFNIVSKDNDLSLDDINKLILKIREKYNNINIIYGTYIVPFDENGKFIINVILTHSDKPIKRKIDYNDKPINDTNTKYPTSKDEKELLYNVACYCVNNPITVNGIQSNFGLGFNKVQSLLNILEGLVPELVGIFKI